MLKENMGGSSYLSTIETTEESLVSYYEKTYLNLNKSLVNNTKFILREFDCWQGIADIVMADITGDIKITLNQAEIMKSLTNSQVISLLHYRSPRTYNYIKRKLGYTEGTIRKSINLLLNNDIIVKTNTGSFLLNSQFILPKVEFQAFEAKLQNWKRALYQSIQYYGFSHYSWVVMPKKYIKPALRNLEAFNANGIGLISIDKDGERTIHLKAIKSQPRRRAYYLVGLGKLLKEFLSIRDVSS